MTESTMSAQQFQHMKLDNPGTQIRLIQIHSSTGTDNSEEISCTVHVRTNEHYTAVSYQWGDERPVEKIKLNGQPFEVRENLHNLLLHLRESWSPFAGKFFWIDQMCVDQQDTEEGTDEKAKQVAMMDDIYAEASKTIVWLGKGHYPSGFRITSILEDVVNMCSNDYWSRLWVVQEICFSTSILIMQSYSIFSWDDFVTQFRRMYAIVNCGLTPDRLQMIQRLIETRSLFSTRNDGGHGITNFRLPFGVVLNWFSGLRCKDPRDQLYALMSLVQHDQKINVDYAITKEELFMQVTERARAIYTSPSDHAEFCRQLLGRLVLEDSNVEISLNGADRRYNIHEIREWRKPPLLDPSEYQYMTTTAGRSSAILIRESEASDVVGDQLSQDSSTLISGSDTVQDEKWIDDFAPDLIDMELWAVPEFPNWKEEN